jgi:hypothetical protein
MDDRGGSAVYDQCPSSLLVAMVNGDRIELFDQYGVMQIDAVAKPQ